MLPLRDREVDIINYLYKYSGRAPYAMEIAKKLGLPKRTVYRNLESLQKKGIVKVEQIGRMKLYKLTEKWISVAEAAKIQIVEPDEAPVLTTMEEFDDHIDFIVDGRKYTVNKDNPLIEAIKSLYDKIKMRETK